MATNKNFAVQSNYTWFLFHRYNSSWSSVLFVFDSTVFQLDCICYLQYPDTRSKLGYARFTYIFTRSLRLERQVIVLLFKDLNGQTTLVYIYLAKRYIKTVYKEKIFSGYILRPYH